MLDPFCAREKSLRRWRQQRQHPLSQPGKLGSLKCSPPPQSGRGEDGAQNRTNRDRAAKATGEGPCQFSPARPAQPRSATCLDQQSVTRCDQYKCFKSNYKCLKGSKLAFLLILGPILNLLTGVTNCDQLSVLQTIVLATKFLRLILPARKGEQQQAAAAAQSSRK